MKTIKNLLVLLAIATITFSCSKELDDVRQDNTNIQLSGHEGHLRPDVQCGTSRYTDIEDSEGNVLGSVEILNGSDQIFVLIDMNHGQFLDQLKVFFGTAASIPLDQSGNMLFEEFQFQTVIANGSSQYSVVMPIGSLPTCADIVIWSQVSQRNMFGQVTSQEEAWGAGIPIHNGQFYKYCVSSCSTNLSAQTSSN